MNVDPVKEEKMDCVDLQTPMARKMSNEWSVKKSSTRSELVSSIETTHHEYDPYAILGLDAGADVAEVKKKYRDLSKKHHPDRGGDPIEFDKIAKAYQALTDDEARENWEKYGNPDGPTAKTFGIALPKWLVSKEYGLWVLAFYGLIFMIVLPVGVGFWWYNSIKYNHDKVLLDTTQLFFYFLHKTPKMEINRMLMVLTGALEVWKEHNKEIVERETDDFTLPTLMKHYPNLGENKKEKPLSFPYALKARILAYAYLGRHDLENDDLDVDQRYIISRVLRLVEEMISCTQQLTFYSQAKVPFETMKNVFKLMPMEPWPRTKESVSGASEAEDTNREDLEEDHEESDIEEDWSKPDKNLFETKTRETHTVHAPYYPSEKFEWWWLTLAFNDKKQRRLCAPVTPCKTLIDTQTFDLKFTAPEEKGVYSFTLGVHSDSYMDADYMMDIKLDVKEAKQAPPVKYEDTEEEEEQIEASSDEEYTEDDDSE
ncbi:unnamed protein product, partial [Mesorhabditis belari]|uniref:J domain-containing protein n=1 Tax=Mesorhabditis belari TaxID=2138241 RepID=A0AAF3EL03_9BILA